MESNSVRFGIVFPKIVKFSLAEATIIFINMRKVKLSGPAWYYHDIWFGTEYAVLEVKLVLSREEIRSIRRRYWALFVQQNVIQNVQLKTELPRGWIAA